MSRLYDPKLKHTWVMKRDLKHTSNSSSEWSKRRQVLEWTSKKLNLNLTEMLYNDLKHPKKTFSELNQRNL